MTKPLKFELEPMQILSPSVAYLFKPQLHTYMLSYIVTAIMLF